MSRTRTPEGPRPASPGPASRRPKAAGPAEPTEAPIEAPIERPPEGVFVPEEGWVPRVLGRYGKRAPDGSHQEGGPAGDGGEPGSGRTPRLVIVAGMHGNETGGVLAVQSVMNTLARTGVHLKGEVVALSGNRPALAAGQRYLEEDLNRRWTPANVAQLRTLDDPPAGSEAREQWELLRELDALLLEEPDTFVLDLHSTSGPGSPFACISDTLRARELALSLPLPLILGIEEAIHGTLLDHMEREGKAMLLVEGGQHDHPDTATHLEATIWLVLQELGMLPTDGLVGSLEAEDPEHLPDPIQCRARLERATRGLPRVLEVLHRHEVRHGDGFRMEPGYRNFQPVGRGHPLATSLAGPVVTPTRGLLLMPLYQPQGADGFFVGRPVRRSWLHVSTWMRALRVDRLLRRLPGVAADAMLAERVAVDPAIARWGTMELFHLAGFRRLPDRDDGLLRFSRRPEP